MMSSSHGTIGDAPLDIRHRLLDRVAWAPDASHFALTPSAVVVAQNVAEVSTLMRRSTTDGTALTFRSGGTSLSGQAVTEHVLVDTRRHFRGVEVLDGGARVRVAPGTTLRTVNTTLARYGRRLGPDPASEAACTIGGIVANNSSGMSCGTTENSYRTMSGLTAVLPSGTVLVWDADDNLGADARLARDEPILHAGLARLRDRVRANGDAIATITAQFAMKNTMGYSVNALLDFDEPAAILAHLLVGSEGTLAFLASVTFDTVPVLARTATGLVFYDSIEEAALALPSFVSSGASAIELMDSTAMAVGAADSTAAEIVRTAPPGRTALLVEYRADSEVELRDLVMAAPRGNQVSDTWLSTDPGVRRQLWHTRKGLYATVAGARPPGTIALLEDIVVPVPQLAATCRELDRLFERHRYAGTVTFGHARDGNLHFMLVDRFDSESSIARYEAFTEDLVDVVLGFGGSLKAEHGTGRVMAAFVRRQYGDELYEVMREIKQLCDPHGVLNPGVLVTDDPRAHLRDLQVVPATDPEVDRCVECGYCEPVCPSRDLTLTPRQRIGVRRERAAAEVRGDLRTAAELSRDFDYAGIDTCAADGMCAQACPVDIDTGGLVRRLRAEQQSSLAQAIGRSAARHLEAGTRVASVALTVAHRLPRVAVAISSRARAIGDPDVLPMWSPDLPRGGSRRRPRQSESPQAVLFPSCTGAVFGGDQAAAGPSTSTAILSLAAKAGVQLVVPDPIGGLCCGTPWSSKGLVDGKDVMSARTRTALLEATGGGAIPVITDASSCTEGLRTVMADSGVTVMDATTFARHSLLDRLNVRATVPTAVIHPTCSSAALGIDDDIIHLASTCATKVIVPVAAGCCGFGGDRGMLHPELTSSATAAEAAEVLTLAADSHVSCNRTCEIAMSRAVGRPYEHVLQLLDSVASARR